MPGNSVAPAPARRTGACNGRTRIRFLLQSDTELFCHGRCDRSRLEDCEMGWGEAGRSTQKSRIMAPSAWRTWSVQRFSGIFLAVALLPRS